MSLFVQGKEVFYPICVVVEPGYNRVDHTIGMAVEKWSNRAWPASYCGSVKSLANADYSRRRCPHEPRKAVNELRNGADSDVESGLDQCLEFVQKKYCSKSSVLQRPARGCHARITFT